ncbi:MAG: ComEC family competence protein, partial [Nevskiaceae bacterium]
MLPRAILAYSAGVLLLVVLPQWPAAPWTLALLAAGGLLEALLWRRWPALRGLLLPFALGLGYALWRGDALLAQRWPLARHGEELVVSGRIASLPELSREAPQRLRAKDAGDLVWRFSLAPDDPALPARIRVSWYRTDQWLRGGECWRFSLRLKTPRGSANPHGFDYEGWLFRQGIAATATVRSAERCEAGGGYWVLRARQTLLDRLQAWLPESPARALTAALVLGYDGELRDADWDAFRLTGTSHLVAISGFNLAIVAGFAWWLLRWSWSLFPTLCLRLPAQKAASLGAALVAAGYALLAGFEPPVLR